MGVYLLRRFVVNFVEVKCRDLVRFGLEMFVDLRVAVEEMRRCWLFHWAYACDFL